MTTITQYDEQYRAMVVDLWRRVFADDSPHNEPGGVINAKTASRDGLFFIALDNCQVIGTAMGGYDGHRGWLYLVAVDPSHRGRGIGSDLVRQVMATLRAKGCNKMNLQIRDGNEPVRAFYESLGFTVEPRVSMGTLL